MAYASSTDVAALLAREVTTEEIALVERRLEQVERMLIRRIPDLAAQIDAEDYRPGRRGRYRSRGSSTAYPQP